MRLHMTRSNSGASTPTVKSSSSSSTTPTATTTPNGAMKSYTNNVNANNNNKINGRCPVLNKIKSKNLMANGTLKKSPLAEVLAAAAAERKTEDAEDMSTGDGDDVETTSVELRSTSLEYRHGINTLRSRSTSAILLDTGSLVLLSPNCLNNGQSSSTTTTTTTTSSHTTLYPRPRTLNVHNARQTPTHQTQFFFGEVLNAWRAKARCNVVPDERTQELFHELSFHPSQKQISEMLQTAKKVARKGSGQSNGLTFGQFCVLAADLKRFRASTISSANNFCDAKYELSSSLHNATTSDNAMPASTCKNNTSNTTNATSSSTSTSNATNKSNSSNLRVLNKLDGNHTNCGTELRSTKSFSSVDDTKKKKHSEPVEVFLGGSCNPTTWRADVAIPALRELGISFYNPQVSDWTPDLIELEHRAKEKARVLFFVMDSETRASAGAIEAAHIAGQNCKQLVLVLHPYKPNQTILNEPISEQEYIDLTRNQMILKELVTRRGLPVLDNIPSGLQRTKEILSGIRDPPSKISSILDVVRGAFDRVNPINELLTVAQCQRALLLLGYAESLLHLDNLNKIIINQRESLKLLQTSTNKQLRMDKANAADERDDDCKETNVQQTNSTTEGIDFDLFCVISAYLSVLQQEIHESGCISPIKGTNVPPPPVYFTNAHDDDIYFAAVKNISRTSSNASVPSNSSSGTGSATDANERPNLFEALSRSRDSGTSSPQPTQLEPFKMSMAGKQTLGKQKQQPQILLNVESIETTEIITTKTIETNVVNAPGSGQQHTPNAGLPSSPLVLNAAHAPEYQTLTSTEEESDDSNDSVFSSSSSIASVTSHPFAVDSSLCCYNNLELRDVYLGGSCVLRTKWREQLAVPFLKAKGISFHMPALQASIPQSQQNSNFGAKSACATGDCALPSGTATATVVDNVQGEQQQRSFVRTRRKCRGAQLQLEEEEELTVAEESWSWTLPLMGVRTNLYSPSLLDSSRVLLFVITNETRSLAPMTLAAHCIGLMYNVVLAVQMLPEHCVLGNEKLTPAAIKDYNRGRSYLIDLAKRQGVPVFNDIQAALNCTVEKIKAHNNRNNFQ